MRDDGPPLGELATPTLELDVRRIEPGSSVETPQPVLGRKPQGSPELEEPTDVDVDVDVDVDDPPSDPPSSLTGCPGSKSRLPPTSW